MSTYLGILRFVHIFAAIFWVGTTLFMVLFLEPTLRKLGPEGSKFMPTMLGSTRFSLAIAGSGWLTVVAGLLMFGAYTNNWSMAVIFGSRLPLTLGAVAGIGAGVVGTMVQGRSSGKLMALGGQIAAQQGPPQPPQLAEMQRLQGLIRQGSVWSAVLMVAAVIGMTW